MVTKAASGRNDGGDTATKRTLVFCARGGRTSQER